MTDYEIPISAGTGSPAPAVPGLTFRRFRRASDYPALAVDRATVPTTELYERLDYQAMRRFTDYRKALA